MLNQNTFKKILLTFFFCLLIQRKQEKKNQNISLGKIYFIKDIEKKKYLNAYYWIYRKQKMLLDNY